MKVPIVSIFQYNGIWIHIHHRIFLIKYYRSSVHNGYSSSSIMRFPSWIFKTIGWLCLRYDLSSLSLFFDYYTFLRIITYVVISHANYCSHQQYSLHFDFENFLPSVLLSPSLHYVSVSTFLIKTILYWLSLSFNVMVLSSNIFHYRFHLLTIFSLIGLTLIWMIL